MRSFTAAALVALIALCSQGAHGHGYLAVPKSRNFLNPADYCPHCNNAGGVNSTKGTVWPSGGRHGACGNPFNGERVHEAGGEEYTGQITGTYIEGGLIHVAAAMSTYHKGMIEYRICRFSADADERKALTEDCLDEHRLVQAEGSQNPGDRWYFLGNATDQGWVVPKLFHATYKLPAGLTCSGDYKCVLQMHWVTGNTCSPKEIPQKFRRVELQECGPTAAWPEEFWNCADIRIVPKGTNGVVLSAPRPEWPEFSPAIFADEAESVPTVVQPQPCTASTDYLTVKSGRRLARRALEA